MATKNQKLVVGLFMVLVLSVYSFAQDMPTKGFNGEFVGQVKFVQGKIMDLQEAIPESNYKWRPSEGVRSVGDVFRHVTLGNYYFIKFSGHTLPDDINLDVKPDEWDKAVTDKAEIRKALARSFDDLLATAGKITEADLEKEVHVFGMDMSVRNFMVSSLNHMHEHLGQAIAYARCNNVVPPWSK